jgi:hypothetical protein
MPARSRRRSSAIVTEDAGESVAAEPADLRGRVTTGFPLSAR